MESVLDYCLKDIVEEAILARLGGSFETITQHSTEENIWADIILKTIHETLRYQNDPAPK
jgi:hypothetical protein